MKLSFTLSKSEEGATAREVGIQLLTYTDAVGSRFLCNVLRIFQQFAHKLLKSPSFRH